jgi:hypothetical protein
MRAQSTAGPEIRAWLAARGYAHTASTLYTRGQPLDLHSSRVTARPKRVRRRKAPVRVADPV